MTAEIRPQAENHATASTAEPDAAVHTDTTDTPLVPILLDVNVIQLSEEELKMMGWKIKK